ncbi:hypothetical protein ACP70R_035437 [Stipagrostis hirtigluma subsp. patula]
MAIKMDKTAIIVSAVVGCLGLLGAILGFAAEGANYSYPSPGMGISAAIFVIAAQIIVTAVSGCFCCCKSRVIVSETKRIVGICCAVGSWILVVIAFVLLVEGAGVNIRGYYVKPGIYAGGGVLALAATALGIASFIVLRGLPAEAAAVAAGTPNKAGEQPPTVGIPMGQPQFPPAAAAGAPNKPGEPQPPTGDAV